MLIVLSLLLFAGVILLIVGLRGRVVDDHPYCRKCGFNLHGRDPASSKCPECGTTLRPAAIRIGLRRRRPGMMTSGALLMVLSTGAIAVIGWSQASNYDWSPWKPTKWLLEDIEGGPGPAYAAALKDLKRRVQAAGAEQSTVDQVVDRALMHQADRSKRWDPAWPQLILDAANAKRVNDERLKKCLQQGVTASLTIKPKLRRGQFAALSLRIEHDRMLPNTNCRGEYSCTPLMLGSAIVGKRMPRGSAGGTSYSLSFTVDKNAVADLPNGKHAATLTVVQTFGATAPIAIPSVNMRIPLSTPVELFDADAIVDEFVKDPEQRQAMQDAVPMARVITANKKLDVRIKTGTLPVSLAAEAFLVQGSQEQRIGTLRVTTTAAPRWSAVWTTASPRFTGRVDVHLRPSQTAADPTEKLGQYWGEPLILRDVLVDAPYEVPFNTDPSLRGGVVKAIRAPRLTRTEGGRISIDFNFHSPPVKLAYRMSLKRGEREVTMHDTWVVSAKENFGWGTSIEDVDPDHKASECDVILRPDPDWEIHSTGLTPPWNGVVILKGVKIASPPARP